LCNFFLDHSVQFRQCRVTVFTAVIVIVVLPCRKQLHEQFRIYITGTKLFTTAHLPHVLSPVTSCMHNNIYASVRRQALMRKLRWAVSHLPASYMLRPRAALLAWPHCRHCLPRDCLSSMIRNTRERPPPQLETPLDCYKLSANKCIFSLFLNCLGDRAAC